MQCLRRSTAVYAACKFRKVRLNSFTTCSCIKDFNKQSSSFHTRSLPGRSSNHLLLKNAVITRFPPDVWFITVRNYMKIPAKKKKGKSKVSLSKEEMEALINVEELHAELTDVVEDIKEDFLKNLTLRTASGAVESLPVEFEDEEFKLNEVAQIQRKGSHLIVINASAFPNVIPSILKSLDESGMNFNPQQEGNTIYVTIPMVTREHRETLAKNAKMMFMKSKDMLRDVQHSYVKQAQKQKGLLSDDLIFNTQHQIISITEEYIMKAEKMLKAKQEELLGNKK